MKKIVKLTSIVLAALLALCAFASCGTTTKGPETDTPALKTVDIQLTEEEYAYAVQKGNTELLASLNAFLETIKADGTFEAIINKYFADGTPSPVKSAPSLKTDGSQLVVATNAAFEPFEYMKGENYYGVDMEIMDLFAKSIGKELYINNMEFDAVCLSVSALGGEYEKADGTKVTVSGGVCDVAASGLTVSDKRKETLDFSTSYYNAAQKIIVAGNDTTFDACKTAEDVVAILNSYDKSTKVGVQNATTGQKYAEGDADWGFDGFNFSAVGYANGALAVQDIINGNIKFVIIDEGPANAIVKKVNEAN